MSFDFAFATEILPLFVPALWTTVQATLAGMAVALCLGLVFALARRAPQRWIAWFAASLIEFLRSTPLLVQLYFLFYVMPEAGLVLSPLATGILALGLHYGAYCSEVYRAGIESVPRGQWEAAAALNFRKRDVWTRIVLPQAVPPVVPALGNYLVAMIKDTPLLSAVTVVEMLQAAKMIGAESFRYLEPLTLVGLFFLALSLASAMAIRGVQRKLHLEVR